jgi:hypothetical protein
MLADTHIDPHLNSTLFYPPALEVLQQNLAKRLNIRYHELSFRRKGNQIEACKDIKANFVTVEANVLRNGVHINM